MRAPGWLVVVLIAALAGLVFASISTSDFVQHLDRQVHHLHCSFIPGAAAEVGPSGCQVAMMSPYSSLRRTSIWGGVPISMPAMATFAFLFIFAADLALSRRKDDRRATGLLVLATSVPVLASMVMAIISFTQLGTACTLCVGIYVASAAVFIGALGAWRRAIARGGPIPVPARRRRETPHTAAFERADGFAATQAMDSQSLERSARREPSSARYLASMFGVGTLALAVPVIVYLAMAPDHSRFLGTCGELAQPQDNYGVMVQVTPAKPGAVPAVEILDPLCPACRAFENRLATSKLDRRLDRKAILFPLDTTCNWMITENTHPGACAVSEAVLCAGEGAPEVIAWAFEAQDRIRTETAKDPAAAARMVSERFPELRECVGSPAAKSRLNKSLRWAVANNIRVLTPQLFVNNVKLCDEDVDLGLDYALSRMIDGKVVSAAKAAPEAAPQVTPPSAPRPAAIAAPAKQPPASGPPVNEPAARSAAKPGVSPAAAPAPTGAPPIDKSATPPASDSPATMPGADQPAAPPPPAPPPAAPPAPPPATPPTPPAAPPTPPAAPAGAEGGVP